MGRTGNKIKELSEKVSYLQKLVEGLVIAEANLISRIQALEHSVDGLFDESRGEI